MAGLRVFIEEFFMCEECRSNFLTALNAPAAAAVVSRDDSIEWLWRTHNNVNSRIAAVRYRPCGGCLASRLLFALESLFMIKYWFNYLYNQLHNYFHIYLSAGVTELQQEPFFVDR
jgi:hypothetical protein